VVRQKECRWFLFPSIRFDQNLGLRFHSLVPRHRMPFVDFFVFSQIIHCAFVFGYPFNKHSLLLFGDDFCLPIERGLPFSAPR